MIFLPDFTAKKFLGRGTRASRPFRQERKKREPKKKKRPKSKTANYTSPWLCPRDFPNGRKRPLKVYCESHMSIHQPLLTANGLQITTQMPTLQQTATAKVTMRRSTSQARSITSKSGTNRVRK